MSLEGNLRDLALAEVCQLLVHTRKSGELRLKSQLSGYNASISFENGAIIGAEVEGMGMLPTSDFNVVISDPAQAVENAALEILCWQEGEFKFVARTVDVAPLDTGVRLNTELLLMEGTRRNEQWARLSDRIHGARSVPTFVDVEPRQLPLLNLEPQQWEVLTGVDGQRDLTALAHALGRDLLEVAEAVHTLIGTGLLALVETARASRAQATPPSNDVVIAAVEGDVWVPHSARSMLDDDGDDTDDEIFDPVRVDVLTPEGLPRLRTPLRGTRALGGLSRDPEANDPFGRVSHRTLGDAAARRGDLDSAVRHWRAVVYSAAVSQSVDGRVNVAGDLEHAQEAIALASRLQQLLQANQPAA